MIIIKYIMASKLLVGIGHSYFSVHLVIGLYICNICKFESYSEHSNLNLKQKCTKPLYIFFF